MISQGRKWLPKAGWASSNAACHRCPGAPSILSKPGWAIAHPAQPPVTPLHNFDLALIIIDLLLKNLNSFARAEILT